VGIDTLLEKAKVSKKTLYTHFPSKNALILAVVRRYDESFRHFLLRELDLRAANPYDKLLCIFDIAGEWFASPGFHGCLALKAISEFAEEDRAVVRACEEFKRLLREQFERLAKDAGALDAPRLASELCLILEGAVVSAQIHRSPLVALHARTIAKRCIDAQV